MNFYPRLCLKTPGSLANVRTILLVCHYPFGLSPASIKRITKVNADWKEACSNLDDLIDSIVSEEF